ncbi:MAG: sigma-70 family RNA polymerase sigma factor [Archangium sp.]
MSLSARSDEALLEAWRSGQLAAFDALYARYERPLFGFIVRQLDGDRAEAEDVLHQTFISVLREKSVLRVRALLYDVARNACANRRRSIKRGDAVPKDEAGLAVAPDELLMKQQASAALQRALTRLPPTLNEVWSLRAAGLSYDEVAKTLGVPLGTVKSRLHEVVSRLREEMRDDVH